MSSKNGRARLGLERETWRRVVKAIEDALPLYDEVNELVSFGRAKTARRYAIEHLEIADSVTVLDGGIGPGNMSKMILSLKRPGQIVGLDGSATQLKVAWRNLTSNDHGEVHIVRGSFEALPFRDGAFDRAVTSYALRDSLDLEKAIAEYARICRDGGRFAVVDIGKSDNAVKRFGSAIYVRLIMPLVAKVAIRGKIKGNPWRMIAPTYTHLPTNGRMRNLIAKRFPKVESKEFLMGGVLVLIGFKPE